MNGTPIGRLVSAGGDQRHGAGLRDELDRPPERLHRPGAGLQLPAALEHTERR